MKTRFPVRGHTSGAENRRKTVPRVRAGGPVDMSPLKAARPLRAWPASGASSGQGFRQTPWKARCPRAQLMRRDHGHLLKRKRRRAVSREQDGTERRRQRPQPARSRRCCPGLARAWPWHQCEWPGVPLADLGLSRKGCQRCRARRKDTGRPWGSQVPVTGILRAPGCLEEAELADLEANIPAPRRRPAGGGGGGVTPPGDCSDWC